MAGGTATILIYRLGTGIDQILRENYDSVIYMRDLNEALERIDSSFQFALAGASPKPFSNTRRIGSNSTRSLVRSRVISRCQAKRNWLSRWPS